MSGPGVYHRLLVFWNLNCGIIPLQLRKWQSTPVFLPGEFHGQRSLAGYSPWGREEWDTTERLTHSAAESERFRSDCKARVFI